ncbi:MAG: DUF1015 domain-containing protein [Deltaproteobacteria bacterium]|nr:DUF1015 domain-containing protein [Deltaproteobacteria bacterium]
MAVVVPFRALRPVRERAENIASCAYDTVSSEEARRIAQGNEYSFLHVVKSEIDLSPQVDPYNEAVYEKAALNLQAFIQKGLFIRDEIPRFYVYRQTMGRHVQDGIVASVAVSDYRSGLIKQHELTRSDKERDRTKHIMTVNAQTGPVFMTYRYVPAINEIVGNTVEEFPEYDFTADDGVRHTAWIIGDDGTAERIRDEFSKVPVLYIADGHHRAASAAAVQQMRAEANPVHTGGEEYNFMMAVLFPHDHLNVMAYNRVVRDLGGLDERRFLEQLSDPCIMIADVKEKIPDEKHRFCMYLRGRWFGLQVRPEHAAGGDAVETLDVSILQRHVLEPILNIRDVRNDSRIDFVGGIRGTAELERLVDSAAYAVAFSLHPLSVDDLIAVSDAGRIMPPKSTWFEPKLRSGIFVHLLD